MLSVFWCAVDVFPLFCSFVLAEVLLCVLLCVGVVACVCVLFVFFNLRTEDIRRYPLQINEVAGEQAAHRYLQVVHHVQCAVGVRVCAGRCWYVLVGAGKCWVLSVTAGSCW